MKMIKFDQISFFVYLSTIFLLPFFFLPFTNFSLGVSKGILVSIGITLSLIFWLAGRLQAGRLVFLKSRVLLAGLFLVIAFFISAFFSPVKSVSFLGGGFEVGTFGSVILCFMAMFLAMNFFRTKKNNVLLYIAFSLSFIVLFLSVVANLISGPGSSLASIIPINLVGSWNDFAIFSGLMTVFSLIAIEFLPLNKNMKMLAGFTLAASVFILLIVNFFAAWVVIGLASLFVFINSLIWGKEQESSKFPALSFSIVVFCFIFITANSLLGNYLSNRLHIDNTELRPSLSSTFEVSKMTLSERPLLGSGPNRFSNAWMAFKPQAVNETPLWDANFNYGVGLIPTFVVTTGIIGLLAWLIFFIFLGINGYKSLQKTSTMDFGSASIFLSALLLWIFIIIYTPNIVVFLLAFVLTGVFLGTYAAETKIKNIELTLLKDPRSSFLAILIIIGLFSGSLSLIYGFGKKFISVIYFQKSASSLNTTEGIASAENYLSKSVFWDQDNDLYYRSLSALYLLELNYLFNQKESLSEDSKSKAQLLLSQAETAARFAITKDPTNYLNWLSLTAIYEQLIPLGVEGSYDNAKQSLLNAIALNPKNPGLYARLAKLELAAQNFTLAESNIRKAIELRPNDQDLINFLDQLGASAF